MGGDSSWGFLRFEAQGLARSRRDRLYRCAKRGCDAVNPPYLSFGTRGKGYCLHHVPWLVRLRMWLRRDV